MAKFKVKLSEFFKTDSNYSIMRLGFFTVLIFACVLSSLVVCASIVASFAALFGIKVTIDLMGLLGILSSMFGFAFGGKALQTFGEKSADPPIDDQTENTGETDKQ